jgi:DNA-binding response OmpR family regulator
LPKILVSNNSELLRHLGMAVFRRMGVEVVVAATGDETVAMIDREQPALAIIDAELPGRSGYDVARAVRGKDQATKIVLVVGKRLNAAQMRRVAESGCDEVVVAPMSADELFDIVAIQLGLPRRGSERFDIDLAVVTRGDARAVDGRVTNLSVDGARLVFPQPLEEGASLRLTVKPDPAEGAPFEIDAHVVWAQPRDGGTVVGAAFDELTDGVRARLARLTQWEIIEAAERTRVVIKGDITEAVSFKELMPIMVGRVDFDLSQVSYINSLGVREWINFLKQASIQGYVFHACSIPFVLQASIVPSVLGKGTVASFFAPYRCEQCDLTQERLLQSATVLASDNFEPPRFTCGECGGSEELDDLPERYLAFLRDERG